MYPSRAPPHYCPVMCGQCVAGSRDFSFLDNPYPVYAPRGCTDDPYGYLNRANYTCASAGE